jgi:hypothetical protein
MVLELMQARVGCMTNDAQLPSNLVAILPSHRRQNTSVIHRLDYSPPYCFFADVHPCKTLLSSSLYNRTLKPSYHQTILHNAVYLYYLVRSFLQPKHFVISFLKNFSEKHPPLPHSNSNHQNDKTKTMITKISVSSSLLCYQMFSIELPFVLFAYEISEKHRQIKSLSITKTLAYGRRRRKSCSKDAQTHPPFLMLQA